MNSKRIVVFGATGNIGAYLAVHLKQEGYDVIAVGSRKSDNGFFADFEIKYYSVDIRNIESFNRLPQKDIYAVVHFAGILPSRYEYDSNILIDSITRGTLNVLEYIRVSGGEKIIFPQTPFDLWYLHNTSIPLDPDLRRDFPRTGDHSVYTIAKNAAIDLIEYYYNTFGIKRFILRFFTVYQYHPNPYHYSNGIKKMMPYRILIERALNGETIEVWGDPYRRKEILYVKDLVQVVSKSISSNLNGGFYNVGGKRTVSLKEQIEGIVEIFSPKGRKSKIVYCPEKQDSRITCLDSTKTKVELGYEPRYSYLKAMQDLYEEMKTEPFAKLWGTKEQYY